MVIAANDPFIRPLAAAEPRDNVVSWDKFEIEFELEMNGRRAWTEMIRNGQSAAQWGRRDRACKSAQQRKRIGIGDRQHRNFCQRGGVFDVEANCIRSCADAWSQRITRIERHIRHRSALRAILIPPCPFRINIAGKIAVVARIRINDATNRAVLGRDLGLDAAPRAAIARDNDLALDIDSALRELFVVLRHTVIDIDKLACDVSVDGIGVVNRQLLGL